MLKSKKKGVLVVISSPSGAGKTTIAKKLVAQKLNLELSVSLTTRKPRSGEIEGKDYSFVSKCNFKKKVKKNLFLESAKVFDNFYGTLKSDVIKSINKGKNVLLDIDWQGARQVKKKLPKHTLTIFILPPSIKELKKRLMNREKDINFINKRMSKAKREILHWIEYDYAVVNDNVNNCVSKIKNIILSDYQKPIRQKLVNYR